MPGDALIILGTAVFAYDATKKVLARRETTAVEETPDDAPVVTGSVLESDD